MNIYITGHGSMVKDNSTPMTVNFYVDEGKNLHADNIPGILRGEKPCIAQNTRDEHYIYGTIVDSSINEYHIAGFNEELQDINVGPGKQILRQYRREKSDLNLFPYTVDEKDDNINNVTAITERGITLSSIINLFPGATIHWLACRTIIYPQFA